ncbi:hypothetical protein ACR3K2_37930 [Cryptosporidium serpentis]
MFLNYIKQFLKKISYCENNIKSQDFDFCQETNYPSNACSAQWMLLYCTISSLDEIPSKEALESVRIFISNLPDACINTSIGNCYTEKVKDSYNLLRKFTTRKEFLIWLCLVENQCRKNIGLNLKSCRYSQLINRWK